MPGSNGTTSNPAGSSRSRYSRSLPWLPVATTRWLTGSVERRESLFLSRDQFADALAGEPHHCVKLLLAEGLSLSRRLQLDQAQVLSHHAVEVGLGPEILRVVEVQNRRALNDTAADRRDVLPDRRGAAQLARGLHAAESLGEGHESPRDRGGAGTSVRLQDVTVEGDRALAEAGHVDPRPE